MLTCCSSRVPTIPYQSVRTGPPHNNDNTTAAETARTIREIADPSTASKHGRLRLLSLHRKVCYRRRHHHRSRPIGCVAATSHSPKELPPLNIRPQTTPMLKAMEKWRAFQFCTTFFAAPQGGAHRQSRGCRPQLEFEANTAADGPYPATRRPWPSDRPFWVEGIIRCTDGPRRHPAAHPKMGACRPPPPRPPSSTSPRRQNWTREYTRERLYGGPSIAQINDGSLSSTFNLLHPTPAPSPISAPTTQAPVRSSQSFQRPPQRRRPPSNLVWSSISLSSSCNS